MKTLGVKAKRAWGRSALPWAGSAGLGTLICGPGQPGHRLCPKCSRTSERTSSARGGRGAGVLRRATARGEAGQGTPSGCSLNTPQCSGLSSIRGGPRGGETLTVSGSPSIRLHRTPNPPSLSSAQKQPPRERPPPHGRHQDLTGQAVTLGPEGPSGTGTGGDQHHPPGQAPMDPRPGHPSLRLPHFLPNSTSG